MHVNSVRETTATDRLPVSFLLHVKYTLSYRIVTLHSVRGNDIKISSVKPMKLVSLICLVEYYYCNTQLVLINK